MKNSPMSSIPAFFANIYNIANCTRDEKFT
jgi:hypothetical protein